MANIVIEADKLSYSVYETVKRTIDDNIDTCEDNLLKAARTSKRRLASYDGSWIGWDDLGFSTGIHAAGWDVYRHRRLKDQGLLMAVVATRYKPSLTHLLEFGHDFVMGGKVYGRAKATHYIMEAFKAGRDKLLETCNVDNP